MARNTQPTFNISERSSINGITQTVLITSRIGREAIRSVTLPSVVYELGNSGVTRFMTHVIANRKREISLAQKSSIDPEATKDEAE